MTINVITGSDFHYGASDPIQLTHEIENVFIKKILEVKPEIVAITGDWWHKRLHSDSIPYQKSIQTLLKIATIVTSYGGYFRFVKGTLTHDLETPETLKLITENFLNPCVCKIVTTCEIETLRIKNKEYKIGYLPEEYPQDVESFYSEFFNQIDTLDIVFGHGTFKFAANSMQISEMERSIASAPVFDEQLFNSKVKYFTAFGHIHKQTSDTNVHYNSSFSRQAHGEEDPKGFLHFEITDDKYTLNFIENTLAPKFIKIPLSILLKKVARSESSSDAQYYTYLCHVIAKQFEKFFKIRLDVDVEIDDMFKALVRGFFSGNPCFEYFETRKVKEINNSVSEMLSKSINTTNFDSEIEQEANTAKNKIIKEILSNPAAVQTNINLFQRLIEDDQIDPALIKKIYAET